MISPCVGRRTPRRLPRPMAGSSRGGDGSPDLAAARWRTRRAGTGGRGRACLRQPRAEPGGGSGLVAARWRSGRRRQRAVSTREKTIRTANIDASGYVYFATKGMSQLQQGSCCKRAILQPRKKKICDNTFVAKNSATIHLLRNFSAIRPLSQKILQQLICCTDGWSRG